jgi:ribonucleotide reductase alpha subunit
VGHAQLQHDGKRADRLYRQHRRLLPDHRAYLQKPLRKEQHGGRLHGRQRVLVEDLKKLGLWNADMLEKIKFYDGSSRRSRRSRRMRAKYKEVFEIEPQWLIKAAAYRGRWIDQSQSLNIFYGGTSGKVLSEIYQYAWSLGLKTTYYLRTWAPRASRSRPSTWLNRPE